MCRCQRSLQPLNLFGAALAHVLDVLRKLAQERDQVVLLLQHRDRSPAALGPLESSHQFPLRPLIVAGAALGILKRLCLHKLLAENVPVEVIRDLEVCLRAVHEQVQEGVSLAPRGLVAERLDELQKVAEQLGVVGARHSSRRRFSHLGVGEVGGEELECVVNVDRDLPLPLPRQLHGLLHLFLVGPVDAVEEFCERCFLLGERESVPPQQLLMLRRHLRPGEIRPVPWRLQQRLDLLPLLRVRLQVPIDDRSVQRARQLAVLVLDRAVAPNFWVWEGGVPPVGDD
mmetsp:Transcript_21558/g.49881  ORF Transcript_21558/g.49881 Transcript_21558/m.49881 type:complete len:286 (+) Transcript_21558:406-1263(+)